MMGFEDINLAIETRLYEWDGAPVAWDNVKAGDDVVAAQSAKEPWVRLTVQHGDSITAGVGSSPYVRRTGLIQCQVFVAEKHRMGVTVAAQIADSLADQLQYWRTGALETLAASVRRGGPTDGWFLYVVTVPWRAG